MAFAPNVFWVSAFRSSAMSKSRAAKADDTFEAELAYQREHFGAKIFPPWHDSFLSSEPVNNVRFWPKADMGWCTAHVRFRRQSRHDRWHMSAFAVAIGCKADIACCGANVR